MPQRIINQIFRYKSSTIAFSVLFISVLICFLSFDIYKTGAFTSIPRTDTIGFNGEVYSTVIGPDGTIYVGGFFDEVVSVPLVGGGIAVDQSTAVATLNSRGRTNGRIRSAVPDGSGGWYIGGSFSTVQDVSRNNIAHINSNGSLDTNFDPSTDGEVYSIVLDGSTLYSVGNFLTVNINSTPVLRKRAAAFDISNGVVTSWDPSLNASPVGMLIASSTAYIYGSGFTQVNTTTTPATRSGGIAAFNLTDGTVTSWDPSFGGPGSPKVISAAASADTLYVGGTFTSVSSIAHKSLAAFDLLDGSLKSSFTGGVTDPQFPTQGPPIYAIAVSDTTVYVGGIFEVASSTTSTTTRVNLAAFDFSGVVQSWNPDIAITGASNSTYAIRSLAINNNAVYVAGNIDHVNIGTTNTARNDYAAFDLVNGTVTSWNPDPICGDTKLNSTCSGTGFENVNATTSVTDVYVGGGTQNMTYVGPYVDRNGLAAIDPTTGQVTSWDPNVIYDDTNHFGVYSIAIHGGNLYAGGQFKSVNGGTVRNGLAAFDLTTGTATSWDPNVTTSYGSYVKSIAVNDTNLYAGGLFTTVNGATTRNNLASFNLTDGTVTSWNPDIDTGTDPINGDQHLVNSIALSSTTLYAAGLFSTVNNGTTPATRYNLAAFNLTNGAVTSWNPSIHNSPISDTDWATTTAGTQFTLSLKTNGTLWSWGCDCYGELGNHERDSSDPTQVGTDTWKDIAASDGDASAIGIKTDGTMWSWGLNAFGELGLGDLLIKRTILQVGSDSDWSRVVLGLYHTLALKSDGTLWAWGSNYDGELGQNDLVHRYTPTQIGTDTNWIKIAAGSEFSLAIKSDGTLWAWGYNANGRLGLGDTTERDVPTQVGTDTDWSDVVADSDHVLALKTSHTLWAWGYNANGRLGLGDTTQRLSPTQVGTDTDWASLGAGDAWSFAVKQNGTLYAWGLNSNYKLGLNDTTQRLSPTQVGTDTDWAYAYGGEDHSVGLKTTGRLFAWGDNTSGQVGQNWSGTSYYLVPTEVVRKDQDILIYSISLNSNALYAGGQFTAVNYATTPVYRDDVAGFNLTDGTVTSFNPDLGTKSYGGWSHYPVKTILATDDLLYIGRQISIPNPSYTYSSFTRGEYKLPGDEAMAFNLSNSSLYSWLPNLNRSYGYTSLTSLFSNGNKLIIGGVFDQTNSTTSPNFLTNFAIFSNTSPNAPTSLGPTQYVDGSSTTNTQPQFTFNLSDDDVLDTVKYRVIISHNSDFSSPSVDYVSSITSQGSFSFTVGQSAGLGTYNVGSSGQTLYNGDYYWKVKTLDQDTASSAYTSANSGAIAFTVTGGDDEPTPEAPATCNQPIRYNVSSTGTEANDVSGGLKSSVSADGRYIAYSSKATNLVSGDLNTVEDVFVYDRVNQTTERISVSSAGGESDGVSDYPQISADGRYVVFESAATNLVSDDTNAHWDIFIRDRVSNTTILVSNALGGGFAAGDALSPFISPDGNKVAFSSGASDMIASDTNGQQDIFIKDLTSGVTTRVSEATGGVEAVGYSSNPVLSYDGRYVVFASVDDNLAAGDNNSGNLNEAKRDVFWHDTQTGETRRVSVSTSGVGADQGAYDPSISWDGMIVAFESDSTNLVEGDVNANWDVYVRDMNNSTTEKVDLNDRGAPVSTYGYSYYDNYMSYDGRYITFESEDTDVVTDVTATGYDIFVRDRVASTTRIASANSDCVADGGWGSGISPDGQYVHFMSGGTSLVASDTNGIDDNFLVKMLNTLPVTITALGPSNRVDGSSGAESTPTISFNFSFPAKYQVQIDNSSDFSSPVVDYTSEWGSWNDISFVVGQSEGNGVYTVGSSGQTLSDDSYYWRVRATDNNGVSTAYSTANSGDVAFIVGIPSTPTPTPSTPSSGNASNGPIVGSYGQINTPYVSPFIASIQSGNPPPTPPVLTSSVPEPVPVEVKSDVKITTEVDTKTSTTTVNEIVTEETTQPETVEVTNTVTTTPNPADLSSLPPCPTVLGAYIAAASSNASEKNQSSKSSSNANKATPVENVVALPVDSFDYSINNGATIKEVNAIFVSSIKHAREFRKLVINSINKKDPNHKAVIKYANDQYKVSREIARNARKIRKAFLKNKPKNVPTPAPIVVEQSGTSTENIQVSTQLSTSTNTVTNDGSNSSNENVTDSSPSTNNDGSNVVSVNTGVVSADKDGNPCIVYKEVVLPSVTKEETNTPSTPSETISNDLNNDQDNTSTIKDIISSIINGISGIGYESPSEYFSDIYTSYYDYASADTQDFIGTLPDRVDNVYVQSVGNVAVAVPLLTSLALSTRAFANGAVPFAGFASYLFYFVPQLIKVKRKSKPWGTVYDSITKRPIPFARVELLNSESRKLESAVTDIEGRYGFLVSPQFALGSNALIQLKVYQKNYSFPSVEIPTTNEKILYENIYQGGPINVQDTTVNFDVPMDPLSIDKVLRPTYFGIISVGFNNLLTRLSDGLFVVGVIFGITNYTTHPNLLGLLPIVLILVAALFRVSGFKLKSFGLTLENLTKNVLPFTFIALHNINGQREKFTVSDEQGRYFILSTRGQHILKAYTAAHINPMRQISLPIDAKEGWVSKEIEL